MQSDTDLQVIEKPSLTANEMKAQVQRIQEVMQAVMKKDEHYGIIPGCGRKPTLLKAGAEKLMMTFRLAVDPQIEDLSTATVRRYRVITKVTAQSNGLFLGSGVGECSSDENKYAWREAICKEEWEATDATLRREKWYDGQPPYVVHQLRTNPSDVANTILKMAKKRSLVDAILTVTAASDIFTQDLEEMGEAAVDTPTAPADPESQPSHKPPQPKAPEPYRMKSGKNAGKLITDVPRADLEYMRDKMTAPMNKIASDELTRRTKATAKPDVQTPAQYVATAYKRINDCTTTDKLDETIDVIYSELMENNIPQEMLDEVKLCYENKRAKLK